MGNRIKPILFYCTILVSLETEPVFCDGHSAISTLVGAVSDSIQLNPIENASVSILEPVNGSVVSGGVTDKDGKFRVQYSSGKTIDLAIEFIGYEKKYIYGIDLASDINNPELIDLGKIILVPAVINLDLIRVSGTSRSYQIGVDKNVYKVSKNLLLKGQTGLDALRAIPSVDVDMDGVISLRGDQNVTILVDGVPSGMASGDRRGRADIIPAVIIDRIEIIANPSVEYDPSGMGGIINIITKGKTPKGSGASSKLSVGTYGRYDGLLSASYNKGKLGLSLSGSGKRDHQRLSSQREYVWEYPGLTLTSRQEKLEWVTPYTGTLNISGDYKISQAQIINFGSNLVFFSSTSFDTIRHLYPVEYQMTSEDEQRGLTLDLRGEHYWQPVSLGKRLRTSIFFSQSGEYEKNVNDRNANGLGANDHSHIYKDDAFRNIGLKTYYFSSHNKNIDLHLGAELYFRSMNRELDYLHMPFGFDHDEIIGSAFFKSNYHKSSGYKFEGGLRIESVETEGSVYEIKLPDSHQHQDTSNVFMSLIDSSIVSSPFLQSNFTFYPSARLWYNLFDQTSINVSYDRRTNRPRRPSINPFPVSMIDEYHVRVGNPMLVPELIDIVELGMSHRKESLQLYGAVFYKKILNMIQWHSVDIVRIESLQYEVISTENSGEGNTRGSEFHLLYGYSENFSWDLSFNNWDTQISGSDTPDLNGKASGYLINTSLTGLLRENYKIELSGYYHGIMEVPTGRIDPSYYLDFALEKRIPRMNLAITLSVKDIFDNQSYNITTNESMYNLTSQQHYNQRLTALRWNNYRSIVVSIGYDFAMDNERIKNRFFKRPGSDVNNDYDY